MEGMLITDKNKIHKMWASHFESLGQPSDSSRFDSNFLQRVNDSVRDIVMSCTDNINLTGMLNEPSTCEEIVKVCSKLISGVSGVVIDYEHIRFGGPSLWRLLFTLYETFLTVALFLVL